MAVSAILYDGQTAARQIVIVEAYATKLDIRFEDGRHDSVPVDELTRSGKDGGAVRLGREGHEGWRLILPEPLPQAFVDILPTGSRYGGFIDRIGIAPAIIVLAGITALILFGAYASPKLVAPIIPPKWEENVGDAMVGDFGERRCRSDEAEAAILSLIDRLDPGEYAMEVEAAILDLDWENAAALPGGHIVLFDGAISEWDDPDAVAGVIAHEVAHVRERHVTEALVRELGIGALIRLFADDLGANAQAIMGLSYTRENESEADDSAIRMLERAKIDPRPTSELFDRFAEMAGEPIFNGFLDSHPVSADRAEQFADSYDAERSYRPAFTTTEWAAIKAACSD
ncbi:MAG: M48 family metallopeptidase [Sphingomonas sp.]|nr:M48 family metallopeptidase [Sphingomonas sp.]RZV49437.1 MAG: M48 family metallopeptidase [Sphingomonadaceae bacterium]